MIGNSSSKINNRLSKLPLILLGIAISGPPRPRFRSAEEAFAGGIDTSSIFEITIWGILFLYVLHIVLKHSLGDYKRTVVPNLFLKGASKTYFLYALLAAISAFYSVRPVYTFYFALKFLSVFVIAAYIAQKYRNDQWILVKVVFVTFAVLLVIKIANYIYEPTMVGVYFKNGMYRLTGGWLGGYGAYAAYSVIGIFLIYLSKPLSGDKKLLLLVLFLVALYFVYLSRTRQVYIFMAVTLVPLFFLTKKFRYTKFSAVYLVVLLLLVIYSLGILDKFALIFIRDFESIETFSGRTIILSSFFKHWQEYLPFGNGFEAGSRYWLIRLGFAQRGLGSAHDSISKVSVELGLPGIILLILTLILAWKQYWSILNHAMIFWKLNSEKLKLFLLTIFVGGYMFYLSITLLTNAAFASGSVHAVIFLITLQMLDGERKKDRRVYYEKKSAQNIYHNAIL